MGQTLHTSGIHAPQIAVEMIFRHGLEAPGIVRDCLELAEHCRDGGAVALWSAVAEEIDQRTQPLPRFRH